MTRMSPWLFPFNLDLEVLARDRNQKNKWNGREKNHFQRTELPTQNILENQQTIQTNKRVQQGGVLLVQYYKFNVILVH